MDRTDIEDLFTYTQWANELALDGAAQLSDADLRADRKISHGSILGTLTHMVAAEWLWLERWQGRAPTAEVWAAWSPERWPSVDAVRTRARSIAEQRRAWLSTLSPQTLQAVHPCRRLDGTPVSLPLIRQMQHVVNHATLHRGQVIGMLRQLGRTPPSTDLLNYYNRK